MKKKELERKIQNLQNSISTIERCGGMVKPAMRQELTALQIEFDSLKKQQDPLEQQFKEEYLKHHSIIQEKLKKIYKDMDEVIAYAEEYGISFTSKVRVFEDLYIPTKIAEFAGYSAHDFDYYSDIMKEIQKETGCYSPYSGDGWQHSMTSC